MTPERLAEIEARAEAATPGPWYRGAVYQDDWDVDYCTIGPFDVSEKPSQNHYEDAIATLSASSAGYPVDANTEFIAHARQDIPDLIAEVKRLREETRRLRDTIQELSFKMIGMGLTEFWEDNQG